MHSASELRRSEFAEPSNSAYGKAFDQMGGSPIEAIVVGPKSTVVTVLSADKVERNLGRMTSSSPKANLQDGQACRWDRAFYVVPIPHTSNP